MPKVEPLVGDYCPECVISLTQYALTPGAIVAMCREDLYQILHNGDMERLNVAARNNYRSDNQTVGSQTQVIFKQN